MAAPQRVDPKFVHARENEDAATILVCAYDSEEKFQQNHLEGAISLESFEHQLDSIDKNHEIVFYCA